MQSCCCAICIEQSNVGLLEELGEFKTVLPPGLTCINPCTQGIRGVQTLKIRSTRCTVSSQTKERMTIGIEVEIMFRAIPAMAHTAYYSLTNPAEQITSYVESALRSEVPSYEFEQLFGSKAAIAGRAQIELEQQIGRYGFEVIDLLLIDFNPQRDVVQAYNQQTTARYNRMATQSSAEIKRIESIAAAQAEAEVKRLRGVGAAELQKNISAGLGGILAQWEGGNRSSEVMAMILMEHYFGMMAQVAKAPHAKAIFAAGGAERGGAVLTHRFA